MSPALTVVGPPRSCQHICCLHRGTRAARGRGRGGGGMRTAALSWSADTVSSASSASFTVWQTTSPSTVRSSGSAENLRSPTHHPCVAPLPVSKLCFTAVWLRCGRRGERERLNATQQKTGASWRRRASKPRAVVSSCAPLCAVAGERQRTQWCSEGPAPRPRCPSPASVWPRRSAQIAGGIARSAERQGPRHPARNTTPGPHGGESPSSNAAVAEVGSCGIAASHQTANFSCPLGVRGSSGFYRPVPLLSKDESAGL
jgi:hypothetical protein